MLSALEVNASTPPSALNAGSSVSPPTGCWRLWVSTRVTWSVRRSLMKTSVKPLVSGELMSRLVAAEVNAT